MVMSGFTGRRSTGAAERRGQGDRVFTWGSARAMLPLAGRIVADLVRLYARLEELRPETEQLESRRLALSWPERARRYQLQEEKAAADKELRAVRAELTALGVAVLHEASGLIGFATIVNEREAFFSWRPGEDGLEFWNFAGDPVRRSVPEAWTKAPPKRPGKGKSRSKAP
jgi:hypothetical protein